MSAQHSATPMLHGDEQTTHRISDTAAMEKDNTQTDTDLGTEDVTLPDSRQPHRAEEHDAEAVQPGAQVQPVEPAWKWESDETNPFNWPMGKKWRQVLWVSCFALSSTVGTSIIAPGTYMMMDEFQVTITQANLPLSLYVFALALGPIVGGPLSETVGRYWVYMIGNPLGMLFTLGAGFTHSFAGLCILRFLAGFAFAPSLAIAAGTINEIFKPAERGFPSAIFVLMPFLGSGIGPVIGAFVANRKGWRWTQWTIIFFVLASFIIAVLVGRETFHPILQRKREKALGRPVDPAPALRDTLRKYLQVALLRPISMLLTEPIVGLICLYVACEFATLFSFFGAVPYVFTTVYGFSLEQTGLVFISVAIGCLLGVLTIILSDVFLYRKQIPKHPPHQIPPEYRLYPAIMGSVGLPLGLFWFGWSARSDISWASPAVAIIPFAWGNICLFISTFQYITDCYHPMVTASAASANSFARYALAAAFPLFVLQMYEKLGIGWATSVFGFLAVAQLPLPWIFYKFGKHIRARSNYMNAMY